MNFTASEKNDRQSVIVLSVRDYKETAKSVVLLSETGSMISFNLHGFKSKKSSYKALFQVTNRLVIDLERGNRGRLKLNDAELLEHFGGLKKDYDKISSILTLFHTVVQLPFAEGGGNPVVYKLVSRLLHLYDNYPVKCCRIAELYFYYSLAYCLGVGLNIDGKCCFCQSNHNCRAFDFSSGQLVCGKCLERSSSYQQISGQLNALLVMFSGAKFTDVLDVELLSSGLYKETVSFLMKYFYSHLDRRIISCHERVP